MQLLFATIIVKNRRSVDRSKEVSAGSGRFPTDRLSSKTSATEDTRKHHLKYTIDEALLPSTLLSLLALSKQKPPIVRDILENTTEKTRDDRRVLLIVQ